jgi:hypothetical protein
MSDMPASLWSEVHQCIMVQCTQWSYGHPPTYKGKVYLAQSLLYRSEHMLQLSSAIVHLCKLLPRCFLFYHLSLQILSSIICYASPLVCI